MVMLKTHCEQNLEIQLLYFRVLLACWNMSLLKLGSPTISVATLALMWVLWRDRNRIVFEGVEDDSRYARSSLLCYYFFWVHP